MTHVIPVVDGYVLAGAVRSMPLAGRDVTNFVQQMLRYEGGGGRQGAWAVDVQVESLKGVTILLR